MRPSVTSHAARKMSDVARKAVTYVAIANYKEREEWAVSEIDRCLNALLEGRTRDVEFREPPTQEGKA